MGRRQMPSNAGTGSGSDNDPSGNGRWRGNQGLSGVLKDMQTDMREIINFQRDFSDQLVDLREITERVHSNQLNAVSQSGWPSVVVGQAEVLQAKAVPLKAHQLNAKSDYNGFGGGETPASWAVERHADKVAGVQQAPGMIMLDNGEDQGRPSQMKNHVQSFKIEEGDEVELCPSERSDGPLRDGKATLFPSKVDMVDKVVEALSKPVYSVTKYYWETGRCQAVARHPVFENGTLAIILFNALWMTVDTDYNDACTLTQAHIIFQIAEHFFCSYFVLEFGIRFGAFKVKQNMFKDFWMIFDSILCATMVLDTWLLTIHAVIAKTCEGDSEGDTNPGASLLRIVRMVRLFRTARMARLLRKMPELMIMIKGIAAATRSVMTTLLLLAIIIYVFSLAFCMLIDKDSEIKELYFSSVSMGMVSLLLQGTLPDNAAMLYDLGNANPVLGIIGFIFVLLSGLTVLNMLVGVLVEVVDVVAQVEKEEIATSFVSDSIKKSMLDMGFVEEDETIESISKVQFEAMLGGGDVVRTMSEVDVDVVALVDLTDFLFKSEENMSFGKLLKTVMQLRGNNGATVKDIIDVRKFILQELYSIARSIQDLEKKLLDGRGGMGSRANGSSAGSTMNVGRKSIAGQLGSSFTGRISEKPRQAWG